MHKNADNCLEKTTDIEILFFLSFILDFCNFLVYNGDILRINKGEHHA